MAPHITNIETWQQADSLLQPIFIRLVDHLRKNLEDSPWVGKYHNREIWPDHTEDSVKIYRQELVDRLASMSPSNTEEIQNLEAELGALPAPYPGYELSIFCNPEMTEESNPIDPENQEPIQTFDLWELCYQVCFCNYENSSQAPPAIVDRTLLDEAGEVDWNAVDEKTGHLVRSLFEQLTP